MDTPYHLKIEAIHDAWNVLLNDEVIYENVTAGFSQMPCRALDSSYGDGAADAEIYDILNGGLTTISAGQSLKVSVIW